MTSRLKTGKTITFSYSVCIILFSHDICRYAWQLCLGVFFWSNICYLVYPHLSLCMAIMSRCILMIPISVIKCSLVSLICQYVYALDVNVLTSYVPFLSLWILYVYWWVLLCSISVIMYSLDIHRMSIVPHICHDVFSLCTISSLVMYCLLSPICHEVFFCHDIFIFLSAVLCLHICNLLSSLSLSTLYVLTPNFSIRIFSPLPMHCLSKSVHSPRSVRICSTLPLSRSIFSLSPTFMSAYVIVSYYQNMLVPPICQESFFICQDVLYTL